MEKFIIGKVAVLGAGVMGAQIAAHLTNANVKTILFDLPAKEGAKNGIVTRALDGLAKLSPAPFATAARASLVTAANYDEHLPLLKECDLVIEAISERMDWKKALYEQVAPHLADHAIFASNTSGLSIGSLAQAMPEALRARFCGIHFFNPPRYMKLVEIIPGKETGAAILDQLEEFLTSTLGKGVIRAIDTPNFVANRIGVFSMIATMFHTEKFKLGFDVVDALTGPAIGRAKSATYRTADIVGLDTLAHVIQTMTDTLPDDPWQKYYVAPPWLAALVAKGALGQKSKAGIYMKQGKDILMLDAVTQGYVPMAGKMDDEVATILKMRNSAEQFAILRQSVSPQGRFLWAIFRDVWHYCAVHLADVAHSARDIDLAMRWGFGWDMGPFETWQAAGWQQVAKWIAEDIAAGKSMSSAPLPEWVTDGREGVHAAEGSYSAATGTLTGRSALPVYRRQLFPETVLSETAAAGNTVFETDALRMWTMPGWEDIGIVSFKSKMHTLGSEVLEGLNRALDEAENNYRGLVIWHEAPFAVGANLAKALEALKAKEFATFESMVALFQQTSMRLKYSMVPTVAAVEGLALGGGCEFIMYCDRVVAALESYIGLVEVGVGLLPAGGGCKEFALRAAQAAALQGGDLLPAIQKAFKNIAMAEVAKSAENAREMGFLREADVVVFNARELLFVALTQARSLADCGYRPPLPPVSFPVAGATGVATLKMMLVNMKEGGFISDHDYNIGSRIAECLCGGDVDPGSMVNEKWLLDLERWHFVELAKTAKTQDRIEHMLKTGKPLRN